MKISELPTPVALVDIDIMERNLRRTIEICRTAKVAYRPHIKTHKMPALAQRQIEAGAVGITCAKIGEAEIMATAGLKDIFIAYPIVGRARFERVLALSENVRLQIAVDSAETAAAMGQFFSGHNRLIDAVLEIDTGHHRCGVQPKDAGELARHLAAAEGLRLLGVFTHEGHVYSPGPVEERLENARRAGRQLAEVAAALRARDLTIGVVSVGSSPAQDAAVSMNGITENRPGTNIFNDCTQVNLGACGWQDCALSYLCTVVSRPALDRAIVDGGTKTFSSDKLVEPTFFGVVKGYPHARFLRASEEHGILSLQDEAAQQMHIGDRVRVIPSHVCGSVNLHDKAYGVRGEEVVEEWEIAARGCVD